MPEDEPMWLGRLRQALAIARERQLTSVPVMVADLAAAIGAVEDGPGGAALVGGDGVGNVCVDFQKLLHAVYFAPDEAEAFAAVLIRKALEVREGRE
jgi:hypothetical protein